MALRISVIGTGYLGVVHAASMAALGHVVVAVDRDREKIDSLSLGQPSMYEPGLEALLARVLPTGRLRFTTDYGPVANADVHFLCVGTPQRHGEAAADTSFVFDAAASLAPHLSADSLVVGKSTVPVGTAARLRDSLQAQTGDRFPVRLAWNPEFLREGFAISDTLSPNRLVYGLDGPRVDEDVALLDTVYAAAIEGGTPRVVTDYATAELVKVASNAFLAAKISFINAMAEVCEAVGADVVSLAEAMGHDDRIGRRFLNAGLGFGGGCLPKDVRGFMARADELGAGHAASLLGLIDAINVSCRPRLVDLARQACGGSFQGRRIAVLGAAFKPDSDDIRDSPALEVAAAVAREGACVTVFDPKARQAAARAYPSLSYAETVDEACHDAHLVLHLTEWQEFQAIDPVHLATRVARTSIIDARNCLDPRRWRDAGWDYRSLGRPSC